MSDGLVVDTCHLLNYALGEATDAFERLAADRDVAVTPAIRGETADVSARLDPSLDDPLAGADVTTVETVPVEALDDRARDRIADEHPERVHDGEFRLDGFEYALDPGLGDPSFDSPETVLGRGESEGIVAALAEDRVFVTDDRDAKALAESLGADTAWTLSVLVAAVDAGVVEERAADDLLRRVAESDADPNRPESFLRTDHDDPATLTLGVALADYVPAEYRAEVLDEARSLRDRFDGEAGGLVEWIAGERPEPTGDAPERSLDGGDR
jgi:hypothetical protein